MMLGRDDVLDLFTFLADELVGTHGEWPPTATPSTAYIADRFQVAVEMADGGGAKAEAAALFCALSADRRRMGKAWVELPIRAALMQVHLNGLRLDGDDVAMKSLTRLKAGVADGASWEGVRDWFDRYAIPMWAEDVMPHPNPHGYTQDPEDP